jgi:hypothetical protein
MIGGGNSRCGCPGEKSSVSVHGPLRLTGKRRKCGELKACRREAMES